MGSSGCRKGVCVRAVAHKASLEQSTILEDCAAADRVKCIQEKAPVLGVENEAIVVSVSDETGRLRQRRSAAGADGREDPTHRVDHSPDVYGARCSG